MLPSVQELSPNTRLWPAGGFIFEAAHRTHSQKKTKWCKGVLIQSKELTLQIKSHLMLVQTHRTQAAIQPTLPHGGQRLAFCPLTRPLVADQRKYWMTNHQRHFSNTLHSAASHLPTKPPESTVFLSPPPQYIMQNTAAHQSLTDERSTLGYGAHCRSIFITLQGRTYLPSLQFVPHALESYCPGHRQGLRKSAQHSETCYTQAPMLKWTRWESTGFGKPEM